jgi:hypothetical protein
MYPAAGSVLLDEPGATVSGSALEMFLCLRTAEPATLNSFIPLSLTKFSPENIQLASLARLSLQKVTLSLNAGFNFSTEDLSVQELPKATITRKNKQKSNCYLPCR